mgnify:FL=1
MGALITPDWPVPAHVKSLMTTRTGGVSVGPFANFNLAAHVYDEPSAVIENRRRLRETLPAEPTWLNQIHGTQVIQADKADSAPDADASFTRMPHTVCAVLTADCLPVLLCASGGSVIAAAHAGWRGLAAGVLEATLAAMQVPPDETIVWLGAAIGPDVFEVGAEVRETFIARHPSAGTAFKPHQQKWLADIYTLARIRLNACGVRAIYGGGLCTYTDAARFYSYRRDGVTGRMATLIWLE